MSVRKRVWTTRRGETREHWVADWTDEHGRHIQSFPCKNDAEDWHRAVIAGQPNAWIQRLLVHARNLKSSERSLAPETLKQYARHAAHCARDPEYDAKVKARAKARAAHDRALLRAFKKIQREGMGTCREKRSPT
jgi:hypothetical protein